MYFPKLLWNRRLQLRVLPGVSAAQDRSNSPKRETVCFYPRFLRDVPRDK